MASLKLSGKYKPIFFITEDPSLAGGMIDGLRVYDRDTFDWALARFKPRTIIFSCSEEEFRNHRALVRELVERNVSVRLHTGLERDIAAGHDALKTRPVDIEDLIGRTRQPLVPHIGIVGAALLGRAVRR